MTEINPFGLHWVSRRATLSKTAMRFAFQEEVHNTLAVSNCTDRSGSSKKVRRCNRCEGVSITASMHWSRNGRAFGDSAYILLLAMVVECGTSGFRQSSLRICSVITIDELCDLSLSRDERKNGMSDKPAFD